MASTSTRTPTPNASTLEARRGTAERLTSLPRRAKATASPLKAATHASVSARPNRRREAAPREEEPEREEAATARAAPNRGPDHCHERASQASPPRREGLRTLRVALARGLAYPRGEPLGKRDRERRPLADLALDGHLPSHRLDQVLDDREPEARCRRRRASGRRPTR